MAQSLSRVMVHLVFSTKDRRPVIAKAVEARLHGYLAAVVRDLGCQAYRVGGTADHVHLAVQIGRTITIAQVVEKAKTTSSKWMKTRGGVGGGGFGWQNGYGAFSVSPSHLDALMQYIANQHAHHAKESFQDEFRRLLRRYGVAYEERYVWE